MILLTEFHTHWAISCIHSTRAISHLIVMSLWRPHVTMKQESETLLNGIFIDSFPFIYLFIYFCGLMGIYLELACKLILLYLFVCLFVCLFIYLFCSTRELWPQVSLLVLNLQLPSNKQGWSILYAYFYLYVFVGTVTVQILCQLFNWVVSLLCFQYIIIYTNIFHFIRYS